MATFKTTADYYKPTKYFKIFQPNPSEKTEKSTKGDCVIRAFAIAADLTWLQAFDYLCGYARETYGTPSCHTTYEPAFERFGFRPCHLKAVKAGKKRMTTEDFCKSHPKGRYILRLANHLTAVVDGVNYDTWNTANRCIYKYFSL